MQLEPLSATRATTHTANTRAITGTLGEPALVALDIDGTIATSGTLEITEPVREAVARVRAAGHHVVLASGRSLVGILPIADQLGIQTGWVVASNGAVTARLTLGVAGGYTLEDVRTFDPEPVLQRALALVPEVNLAVEEIGWGYRVLDRFPEGKVNGEQEVVSLADLWSVPVTRAIVKGPDVAERLLGPLRSLDVTAVPAADDWIDVTPTTLSKATSLEIIRRTLRVGSHRTIAVGDGVNDLEMMAWASRSVAMGHSPDLVKAGADEVTGTLDDDGLVPVLLSV
ncbi:HAD family hydrolase [Myceligenerans salitolerans]|uniref:HAD hydrolase family protein n=1 Tax=Myceligenerans salitolerans TaxID=1230528 RepID=A0ABS3I9M2_9MICO|nr:HAD hydrolase family protein [Myceligenerans salitolerans]MBO0609726.1 HAD hydrolase family protein [Myceligenerans salitolerans]